MSVRKILFFVLTKIKIVSRTKWILETGVREPHHAVDKKDNILNTKSEQRERT